jgi:hypothetical protein
MPKIPESPPTAPTYRYAKPKGHKQQKIDTARLLAIMFSSEMVLPRSGSKIHCGYGDPLVTLCGIKRNLRRVNERFISLISNAEGPISWADLPKAWQCARCAEIFRTVSEAIGDYEDV